MIDQSELYLNCISQWTGIEIGSASAVTVTPVAGEVVGCWINFTAATDAALSFSIEVNTVAGSTFEVASGLASGGYFFRPSPLFWVHAGDALEVIGDAAQTGALAAEICWVVRRGAMEDGQWGNTADELPFHCASNFDIHAGGATPRVVAPMNCEFLGAWANVHSAVGTSGTMDLVVNGVDALVDVVSPATIADETGAFLHTDSPYHLAEGDRIQLQGNSDFGGVTLSDVSLVFSTRTANRVRSLNELFLPGGRCTAIQTGGTAFDKNPVCPVTGRVVGFIANVEGTMTAATTFDVEVDGADSGVDATLPVTADDTGTICTLSSSLYVYAGQTLGGQTNGEEVNAVAIEIVWVIER